MFFTSYELQVAANYSDKPEFFKNCRRYDLPIAAAGKVMGTNRYELLDLCLALVIAELQQYEIPLRICARLINRLNLDHLRDRLDKLKAYHVDDLAIMI